MDIQFKGANCVVLQTKKARVVVDDDLKSHGLSAVAGKDDIVLNTSQHEVPASVKFTIDGPGEYEISGVSVRGIAARAHMDEADKRSATIYVAVAGGISVAILGHVYPDLTDDELESIGMVDVLIIPVGGNGYTLDAVGAAKLVKKIEPKLVIPTHYADKGVKYEVPQAELADFLKEIGSEGVNEEKLKLKAGTLPEGTMQVYVLSR